MYSTSSTCAPSASTKGSRPNALHPQALLCLLLEQTLIERPPLNQSTLTLQQRTHKAGKNKAWGRAWTDSILRRRVALQTLSPLPYPPHPAFHPCPARPSSCDQSFLKTKVSSLPACSSSLASPPVASRLVVQLSTRDRADPFPATRTRVRPQVPTREAQLPWWWDWRERNGGQVGFVRLGR